MSYNDPQFFKFPGFEAVDLQNSWTLQIKTEGDLELLVDTRLVPSHPLYNDPLPGQSGYYRVMKIVFPHTRNLRWLRWDVKPYVEIDGEIEYEEIYDFWLVEGTQDHFMLEAQWGSLEFYSDLPTIEPIELEGIAQFPPPTKPS